MKKITTLTTIAIVTILAWSDLGAAPKVSESKCKFVTKKIENTQSRLRAGYKVKPGERLKEKLRKLRRLKRACRQKNYATTL